MTEEGGRLEEVLRARRESLERLRARGVEPFALHFQPTFAKAHHNLAATLADEGRLAEAIEHYTAALQLRPHYVLAHYHLGLALARQGRLAEAQQQCAEVLRLDPTHAGARSLLRLTMSQ